jgi:hypothetical protein
LQVEVEVVETLVVVAVVEVLEKVEPLNVPLGQLAL